MAFTTFTSCCGMNLKTGGLVIGYMHLFLPAYCVNADPQSSILLSIACLLTIVLSVPWIYGVLANDTGFMDMLLYWLKFIVVFSALNAAFFTIMGFAIILFPFYVRGRVSYAFFSAFICASISVVEWFLVSVMNSLYKLMKDEELADNNNGPIERSVNQDSDEEHWIRVHHLGGPLTFLEKTFQKINEMCDGIFYKSGRTPRRDDPPPYDEIWNDHSYLVVPTDPTSASAITTQPNQPNQQIV